MAYKILTKKGIENTNIDGARENFFNSGMRDGIVKGAFNEGKFESNSSNSIYLDSCELRIGGHRVVIDEPAYKTFSNTPSKDTRYSMIAQISVSESADVEFSLFVQSAETVLIKDNLYATGTGQGTYQVEIGKFTLTDKGTVEDVVKTIDNITGTTESIAGGINIGNVTTEKIDYKFNAEVDVTQRYDSEQKKTFTDFNFQIPTQYPVDLDAIEKSVEESKTNSTNALQTANSAKTLAEQAQQQASELETKKADRTELFSGSYNDLKDKPTIPDTSLFAEQSALQAEITARQTAVSNLETEITSLKSKNSGSGSASSNSSKPVSITSSSVKYRIAPDGFKTVYGIVRWNRTNNTDSVGVNINFGTTFTDVNYGVAVNIIETSTDNFHTYGNYEMNRTASGISIFIMNINDASYNAGFSFIIQGY